MKREKNIGTFIEFKIKNQEETIKGVLIDYSDEWTVLYNNPVDFILDGIVLIKNSEIEKYKTHSPASLRMNIFNKKLIHLKQQKLDIGSSEKLFSSLFNKKITVSISNVKDNLFSIGRVKSVQNSEILFETISTNAKWSKKMEKLDIKKISLIEYQTDYTESLLVAL